MPKRPMTPLILLSYTPRSANDCRLTDGLAVVFLDYSGERGLGNV